MTIIITVLGLCILATSCISTLGILTIKKGLDEILDK